MGPASRTTVMAAAPPPAPPAAPPAPPAPAPPAPPGLAAYGGYRPASLRGPPAQPVDDIWAEDAPPHLVELRDAWGAIIAAAYNAVCAGKAVPQASSVRRFCIDIADPDALHKLRAIMRHVQHRRQPDEATVSTHPHFGAYNPLLWKSISQGRGRVTIGWVLMHLW